MQKEEAKTNAKKHFTRWSQRPNDKKRVSRLLSVIRSNAANKEIIKAIMLSNFDAHKASDLADNQIALCAAMITRRQRTNIMQTPKYLSSSARWLFGTGSVKPSKRFIFYHVLRGRRYNGALAELCLTTNDRPTKYRANARGSHCR